MTGAGTHPLPERPFYLIVLASAPAIWIGHFLLSYLTVSIWCSPRFVTPTAPLGWVPWLMAGYTVVALAGIALVARSGYRRHSYGDETAPHDSDSPEDRHRFLGFATLLLAGLSAIATVYVAISAIFFQTCR